MTRFVIAPDVAAALTSALPGRLVKKLDAEPRLAEAWTWSGATVTTDKGEVVTMTVVAGVVTAVGCTCLLAPRCLHVAAVVALLEPAEIVASAAASGPLGLSGSSGTAGSSGSSGTGPSGSLGSAGTSGSVGIAGTSAAAGPSGSSAGAGAHVALAADARAAASHAQRVLGDVLAAGAESSGAFAQAELLRAIHACRTAGLHRLASSQTRALRAIRELRADRAEFALAALTADLRDALAVSHQLVEGASAPALIGNARRDYAAIGSLRLRGVFTEAIVARSGYAGAITYLVGDRGTVYTRADVAPGDAGRAAGAYDAAAGIGDAVLPHRELCRTGLFVSEATASADGRLGAGQKVRAVRASDPSRWDQEPLDARFQVPLADQLAQIAARDAVPDELRPAGWDLVFLDGLLVGGKHGVGIVVGELPIVFAATRDHRLLATRDNLVVLSRATGLAVRMIGRVRLGAPREVDPLAIGPAPHETRWLLPEAWHGRANLHYDKLSIIPIDDAPTVKVAPVAPPDDLLAPLRRRVERAVLGGTGTLPTHAFGELDREAAALDERSLRGAAEVLRDLAAIAHDASRTGAGTRRGINRAAFARAWLRAALYEDTARRRLSIARW